MSGTLAAVPRPATGSVESYPHADGQTVSYYARVPAFGQRWRVNLGTNHEGWNEQRARVELDRIMQQVRRGTWEPPATNRAPTGPDETESFHVFVSRWWQDKQRELEPRGRDDYRWRIDKLLAGPLPHLPVSEIDRQVVDQERARLLAAGLGPRSTNMALGLLAQVLDDAVDYGLLQANPARGRRRRVKEPAKRRAFLEPDQVLDLLDEAGRLEAAARPSDRYGRRAILATLILAGPRITELLDLPRGDLDLHGGRVTLGRKTQAGTGRQVELTAFLLGELRAHLAARKPTGLLFPTRTGGRQTASQIRNRLLASLVRTVNERRAEQGRALIPPVTPHALRRTFASLALAAGRDPRHVMAELGHADARFTLNVYAQVVRRQRVDADTIRLLMDYPEEGSTHGENDGARVDSRRGGLGADRAGSRGHDA